MTDKPKRSERIEPQHYKLRLLLLTVLYTLFVTFYLFEYQILLLPLIAALLALFILCVGSYFVKFLSKMTRNLLTHLAVYSSLYATTFFAWYLFTMFPLTGLIMWMGELFYRYTPHWDSNLVVIILVVSVITMSGLCLIFTFELQTQIMERMAVPNYIFETGKGKNIVEEDVVNEPEPDIPLELLAESESAEQAHR
jgi:hypothetical protein